MRRLLPLLLAPALLAPQMAQAQSGTHGPAPSAAEAKRADVKKILGILKAGELGMQAIQQSLPAMKQASPQVPAAFWDAFLKEFTPQRMEDLVLPVYEEVLSAEEAKAYLAFLSTPLGASIAKKQPLILQKSMEAGQRMGGQVAQEVAARLQAEGKL